MPGAIQSLTEAAVTAPARLMLTRPQLWLGLMLLSLHAALAWDITDWWPRAFLLAHFGLFLLWQPVWRGERNIESRYAFLVVIIGFLFAAFNNWWLMAVWLAVLFGLIGGSVPGITDRRQRMVSMLAALYLLSMLLIWVVPHLFVGEQFETALTVLVQYGLPFLPLAIILMRVELTPRQTAAPIAVDLFYSVFLFLLVAALVLGSFVVKQVSHGDYPLALAQTLFAIAVLLVTLSWLWNPRSGFVGHRPPAFALPDEPGAALRALGAAARGVRRAGIPAAALPRAGAAAHAGTAVGERSGMGDAARARANSANGPQFSAELSFQDLRLKIYTRWSLSPAVLLHLKLLTQMIGHFYDAKRREQAQRQHAYTQAIYETGARLTHDVKNLLQSLRSLCAAVETSDADQAQSLQALMQRQLPQITQRLNVTLDKLQAPQQADTSQVDAAIWWEQLDPALQQPQRPVQRRRRGRGRQAARGAVRQRRRQSHRKRAPQGGGPERPAGAGDVLAGARRDARRVRQRHRGAEEPGRAALRCARLVPHRTRRGPLPRGQAGEPARLPSHARGERAGDGVLHLDARNWRR